MSLLTEPKKKKKKKICAIGCIQKAQTVAHWWIKNINNGKVLCISSYRTTQHPI